MKKLFKAAASWVVGNPFQAAQVAGLALLASAVTYFYFDYRGAKEDVARLEIELSTQKAVNEAQGERLGEFQEAEANRVQRLFDLEANSARIRAEVRGITDRLTASEINTLVEEDPDEAANTINRSVDDAFSLLDDATRTD